MLRNDWTDAWERPDTPDPLGMPLQFMVTSTAVSRGHRYPEQAKTVNFNPAGQVIGQATKVRPVKDVIYTMVEECIEATERLTKLMSG
jgi:NAD(P)H-dependent flavin oxidoreductase YrpB (nitropropane dioxygenase family)